MVRSKNPEAHVNSSTSESPTTSDSTPTQSPAKSPSPATSSSSPPPPPPKTKGKRTPAKKRHPRPKVKVVEPPAKKQKGVTIREPEPMVTRSKSKDSQSKGKKVVIEQPEESSSDSEFNEVLQRTMGQSRLDALVGTLSAQAASAAGTSRQTQSQSGGPSFSQAPEPVDTIPPPGFINQPFSPYNQQVYHDDFSRRSFCPVVYVDLNFLSSECGLNLEEALGYYQPWLISHLPYSPSVVRTFYCNMEPRNVVARDGSLIEEGISTTLRGKSIMITPSSINTLLGYLLPPTDAEIDLSAQEVFQTLRPGDPIGPLNFKPITMPDSHRALFYIYTRSMINKSKNFTHFAQRDYYLMASFLRGHKRNVGEMIFNEMRRFRFSSSRNTTIPYPHIVSLILKHNKVWYLEGKEVVKIPKFGRSHLSHMGINLPVSISRPIPQQEATPSRADEAQSSRRRSPSPAPSFLGASLQGFVASVIKQAISDLKKELFGEYEKLVSKMESEVTRLVDKANSNFDLMFKTQEDQSNKIAELEGLLRAHVLSAQPQPQPDIPPASSPQPHASQTPDDVLFSFIDLSSPVHVTVGQSPEPATQPFSPPFASDSAPIDPSTAIVPYVPPQPDEDKTGEKSD